MTIIQEFNNGHIEYHLLTIEAVAALSTTNSDIATLDRPGFFMGASCIGGSNPGGDPINLVGFEQIRDQDVGVMSFGDSITGISMRQSKAAGTGTGTFLFHVLVWIRDHPGSG